MHPFALRRLFLIAIAVAGFSALCFADPVLMAQRYRSDKAHAVVANSPIASREGMAADQLSDLDEANQFLPLFASTADISLDRAPAPRRLPGPEASWNWHRAWPKEVLYGTTNDSLFLTAQTTD